MLSRRSGSQEFLREMATVRGYVCRGDVILVNVPTADLTVLLSNASYHLSRLYEDSFSTPHIEHFTLLGSCPSAMGPETTQDPDPSRPSHLGWRPRPSTWSCVTLGNLLHSLHTCERKQTLGRGFSGGPVVKALPSNAGCAGSIPSQGTKMPHASWPINQNIKQK